MGAMAEVALAIAESTHPERTGQEAEQLVCILARAFAPGGTEHDS